jgi:hypothetical protein
MVRTYGEIDPTRACLSWWIRWRANREIAAPLGTGKQFLRAVVVALHLVHQRHKAVGVRQFGRKVALSN